ncbi:MAG TPA: preprotein translocase subunit SecA, partial [Pirellulaceae bacterium]|nr:preprotein translocase subunit SecA [Pirellulaceae bacterium]
MGVNLLGMLRNPAQWQLSSWKQLLPVIEGKAAELEQLSERDLRKRSLSLRFCAKSGEPLAKLMPEAYALVREAGRRTIGLRHFDVQLLGGIALFHGAIAEMQTGEGKTLTATLPMYLHALVGKGAHLATVNDYLAKRDADLMVNVYQALGLSVGIIQTKDSSEQRRKAYACDVTYGTAKEFGFDFLRDRLLLRRLGIERADFLGEGSSHRWDEGHEQPVQRGAHFCLVDEADSILIDEARTPLIIGSLGEKAREEIVGTYRWAAENCQKFEEDVHYEYHHDERRAELTGEGRQLLRTLPRPEVIRTMGLIDLYQYIERAIKVDRDFHLHRQYVVNDDEIVIVDEFTGRLAEGRKWRDGIHQAIEAKEGIEVSVPTGQAARITVQDLFLRYHHLCGMTGTVISSASEVRKIYRIGVVQVPTNRPAIRVRLPDMVFGTSEQKWDAIVREIQEVHATGRPVLIGTRSIDKSVIISTKLTELGINHQVLNANEVATEAAIVEGAGQLNKVTVATNMAGRGTDIKLGPGVQELGGLHVICTEVHDSARIDRQLAGRCGRQGDPGSFRQYVSLDDEILANGLGPKKAERLAELGKRMTTPLPQYYALFRTSQKKVEAKHFRDRRGLLYHEKQRKKMQREMG